MNGESSFCQHVRIVIIIQKEQQLQIWEKFKATVFSVAYYYNQHQNTGYESETKPDCILPKF